MMPYFHFFAADASDISFAAFIIFAAIAAADCCHAAIVVYAADAPRHAAIADAADTLIAAAAFLLSFFDAHYLRAAMPLLSFRDTLIFFAYFFYAIAYAAIFVAGLRRFDTLLPCMLIRHYYFRYIVYDAFAMLITPLFR